MEEEAIGREDCLLVCLRYWYRGFDLSAAVARCSGPRQHTGGVAAFADCLEFHLCPGRCRACGVGVRGVGTEASVAPFLLCRHCILD